VALTLKPTDQELRNYRCDCCQEPVERAWNHVYRDGTARAMYFANCYHHTGRPREVLLDVVFGTWTRLDHPDHVTLGCRIVDGQAVLVDPVFGHAGAPLNGRLVSAVEAPTHPLLDEFWEVAAFVLDNDQTLSAHVA
jgi:hypothetical protein